MGSLAIIAWTCVTSGIVFVLINLTVGMRVAQDIEDDGLDASEHGLSKCGMPPRRLLPCHAVSALPQSLRSLTQPSFLPLPVHPSYLPCSLPFPGLRWCIQREAILLRNPLRQVMLCLKLVEEFLACVSTVLASSSCPTCLPYFCSLPFQSHSMRPLSCAIPHVLQTALLKREPHPCTSPPPQRR